MSTVISLTDVRQKAVAEARAKARTTKLRNLGRSRDNLDFVLTEFAKEIVLLKDDHEDLANDLSRAWFTTYEVLKKVRKKARG